MKTKVYRVVPKENPNSIFYMIDALSKRIRFTIKNWVTGDVPQCKIRNRIIPFLHHP